MTDKERCILVNKVRVWIFEERLQTKIRDLLRPRDEDRGQKNGEQWVQRGENSRGETRQRRGCGEADRCCMGRGLGRGRDRRTLCGGDNAKYAYSKPRMNSDTLTQG